MSEGRRTYGTVEAELEVVGRVREMGVREDRRLVLVVVVLLSSPTEAGSGRRVGKARADKDEEDAEEGGEDEEEEEEETEDKDGEDDDEAEEAELRAEVELRRTGLRLFDSSFFTPVARVVERLLLLVVLRSIALLSSSFLICTLFSSVLILRIFSSIFSKFVLLVVLVLRLELRAVGPAVIILLLAVEPLVLLVLRAEERVGGTFSS